jgi:hypothetical protein
VQSINAFGQIAGYYVDSNGQDHGFLESAGIYTIIDPPGSIETFAQSINKSGGITGYYESSSGQDLGFIYSRAAARPMPERRFQPPWSVEETDACFIRRRPFRGQTCSVTKPKLLLAWWILVTPTSSTMASPELTAASAVFVAMKYSFPL